MEGSSEQKLWVVGSSAEKKITSRPQEGCAEDGNQVEDSNRDNKRAADMLKTQDSSSSHGGGG